MKNDISRFWNGLSKKQDPGTSDQFLSVTTLELNRRSQKKLDEFPSVFHIIMPSTAGKCTGNMEIRRIKY